MHAGKGTFVTGHGLFPGGPLARDDWGLRVLGLPRWQPGREET